MAEVSPLRSYNHRTSEAKMFFPIKIVKDTTTHEIKNIANMFELHRLKIKRELTLEEWDIITGISSLTVIKIYNQTHLTEFKFNPHKLTRLPKLSSLVMKKCMLIGVTFPLLPMLTSLSLPSCIIDAPLFVSFRNLPNLKELNLNCLLEHCSYSIKEVNYLVEPTLFSDLSQEIKPFSSSYLRILPFLTKLTRLSLNGWNTLENFDLQYLTALPALTALSLAYCTKIDNFNLLSNLTHLDVTACLLEEESNEKLANIGKLKRLTHLNLSQSAITTLTPLVGLEHLECLKLNSCPALSHSELSSFASILR